MQKETSRKEEKRDERIYIHGAIVSWEMEESERAPAERLVVFFFSLLLPACLSVWDATTKALPLAVVSQKKKKKPRQKERGLLIILSFVLSFILLLFFFFFFFYTRHF